MKTQEAPLGRYLKSKRKKMNLSQSRVADELGYSSPQIVSNWERGLCHPPLAKLRLITKLYRVRTIELIDMMTKDYERRLCNKLKNPTVLNQCRG